MRDIIFLLIAIVVLFISQSSFGSSYQELHGHWEGEFIFDSIKHNLEFDIFDAPCKWLQPNETPYIVVDSANHSNIISTSIMPSGEVSLSSLPIKGLRFNPSTWSETVIEGQVFTANDEQYGIFKVTKVNPRGTVPFCYHKDSALLSDGSDSFTLFSLIYLNGDNEFCCSNGVFSACKLKSKCEFSSMNDNGMYDFSGTFHNNQCNGLTIRTFPEPQVNMGQFILNLDSPCSAQPSQ